MKNLIQEGLFGDNVKRLVQACNDQLDSDPITYFVLRSIFEKIYRRYWQFDSAAPETAVKELEDAIVPPIEKVLNAAPQDRSTAFEELIMVERKIFD